MARPGGKGQKTWAGVKRSAFKAAALVRDRAQREGLPVAEDHRVAGSDGMKKFYKWYDGVKQHNSNEKLARMKFARTFTKNNALRMAHSQLVPKSFASYAFLNPDGGKSATYFGRGRCEKAALVIVPSLQFLSETNSEFLEELI